MAIVYRDKQRLPTVYGCNVGKFAGVGELRAALSKLTNVPVHQMVFGEVWNNKVSRYISDQVPSELFLLLS